MRGRNRGKGAIRCRSDIDRSVIKESANARGWRILDAEEANDSEWDIYWVSVCNVKTFFAVNGPGMLPKQIINHFPNYPELTRKDLLARNLKKYLREKPSEVVTLAGGGSLDLPNDFLPLSFVLPAELSAFQEEFNRNANKKWIFKPASKAQGKGIFLITKLTQVRALPMTMAHLRNQPGSFNENFVVCRYLQDPLLIGGKKFDLRLFVLVTSYKPLVVWRYEEGFARLCFEDYGRPTCQKDPNAALFAHLTNVSFQKNAKDYNDVHGGKWPLSCLLDHIELNHGRAPRYSVQRQIDQIFLKTLRAAQGHIIHCPNAFELYGFDILIDSNFKCWLIEVNASPSLLTTTEADKRFKKKLITDVFAVVAPEEWEASETAAGPATSSAKRVGGFELLFDERLNEPEKKVNVRPKSLVRPSRALDALTTYSKF